MGATWLGSTQNISQQNIFCSTRKVVLEFIAGHENLCSAVAASVRCWKKSGCCTWWWWYTSRCIPWKTRSAVIGRRWKTVSWNQEDSAFGFSFPSTMMEMLGANRLQVPFTLVKGDNNRNVLTPKVSFQEDLQLLLISFSTEQWDSLSERRRHIVSSWRRGYDCRR